MRVLVTGASKGIGAACASALLSAGWRVAIHYKNDSAGARAIGEDIYAADLSRWDEGERLVAAVEKDGPLDAVVLNHGIWTEAAIESMTEATYDETMDANLRGFFSVAGAAVRRMKPRKSGRIVMISSTAGQRGESFHSHYAATKGAIISMTKSLAVELAPHRILVNCVAPGWVATPMTLEALKDPAIRATIPLGRAGEPGEIASAVTYLLSPGASFITGEILNVNGGAVLVG